MEDQLAAGTKLRVISLSDHNPIGDRDEALHHRISRKDLNSEFAAQALSRG